MNTITYRIFLQAVLIFAFTHITDSIFSQVAQHWIARYDFYMTETEDAGYKIVVDINGNAYVGGQSGTVGTLVKYNSSGVQQWANNSIMNVRGVLDDGFGNINLAGVWDGSSYDLYYLEKFRASDGYKLWENSYPPGFDLNNADVTGAVVDSVGNTYMTGYMHFPSTGTASDYATVKINTGGVFQWITKYNGPVNDFDRPMGGMAFDGTYLYVTGYSPVTIGNNDITTVKYNLSGAQVWAVRYNGPNNLNDAGLAVTTDDNGNVYVTGYSIYTDNADIITIKYNSSGTQQWAERYSGNPSNVEIANGIAVDNSGNVYIMGSNNVGINSDILTIKYNSSGVQQWTQVYNSIGEDNANTIKLDAQGNVYIAGTTSINNKDFVTIKYDPNGIQQWLETYHYTTYDICYAMTIDSNNCVYVTGSSYVDYTHKSDITTIKYIQSPLAPILSSPPNSAINQPLNLALKWRRNSGTSHRVQIATDALFNNIILDDSTVTDTLKSISGLQTNQQYFWRVSSKNAAGYSPWSLIWTFTTLPPAPSQPVLLLPANNAVWVSLTPLLDWADESGAETYGVQLSTDAGFATTIINQNGLTSSQFAVSSGLLQYNTIYFWRVNATNVGGTSLWSAIWIFTTAEPPPSPPILVSPSNGAANQSLTPLLNWNDVSGSESYNVQLSTDTGFGTTVINQTGLSSSEYQVAPGILTNNTLYYWRVSGSNQGGQGNWSARWNFTTIVAAPPVPVPTLPANNSICETLTAFLQWNAASGATSYNMQLSTDSLFGTNIIDTTGVTVTQLTIQPGRLQYFTKYYWRMAAVNIGGTSAWCNKWNYTTILATPLLNLPVNNAVNQPITPTINWRKITGAENYSLQVSSDSNFTSLLINQASLPDSQYVVPGGTLQNSTLYFWRVRGNMTGCSGSWSTVWRFTTIIAAPSAPMLSSPPNNSLGQPVTPVLVWLNTPTTISYRLQLSTDSTFASNAIDTSGLITLSYNVPAGRLQYDTRYFWRVSASNIGGTGPWSASWNFRTVLPIITFNLTMIPGGFYNTSTSALNMKDTIKAYLIDTAGGCHKVDSAKGVVDSVSFAVQLIFQNANSGNYYIFVYHRNHLAVSSADLITFTRGSTTNYNFTDAATKAFGSNMIQVSSSPVRWGLIPADANRDGFVDAMDQMVWINLNGLDGYLDADFNGDAFVDATDQLIWISYNGTSAFLPCEIGFDPVLGNPILNYPNYDAKKGRMILQEKIKKDEEIQRDIRQDNLRK